ncbi:MAG: T9SS type A sorting domain-containing protein [Lewinellaceae bacterium]|nr:T9SS type A sorting domain-containing protein [Lewinellaceae bacterium]
MRWIFFTIGCTLLNIFIATGQCTIITLRSQQDIDQFPVKYPDCKILDTINIYDDKMDVSNFDSLYPIERINGELYIFLSTKNKLEKRVSGMNRLKYTRKMSFGQNINVKDAFPSLDTVNSLLASFWDNPTFMNVKHIDSLLSINGTIEPAYFPHFTHGNKMELRFNGIDATSAKYVSSKIGNVRRFILSWSSNLKVTDFPYMDTLDYFNLNYSSDNDLSWVESAYIQGIYLNYMGPRQNFGKGFLNTHVLEMLVINRGSYNYHYSEIFPNLEEIRKFVYINNVDSIFTLKFLEGVKIPSETPYINIMFNRHLNDCNVSFLCDALAMYPDSVFIANNGPKCTRESVLAYCKSVATQDDLNAYVQLYPNPAIDFLTVDGVVGKYQYDIYDISGKVINSGTQEDDQIFVGNLPSGIYSMVLKWNEGKPMQVSKRWIKG